MQSSRKKRERSENDQEADDGASRGAARKPKIRDGAGAQNQDEAGAAEVSPQVEEPKISTGQAESLQGATNATEGTNGGHHSLATTTGPTAMDISNDAVDSTTMGQDCVWQGTGKETRQEQIAALISHRKLLLERMMQCKCAADSRMKRNAEKQQQENKVAGDVAKRQDGGQASSDNEEIERYRETCRLAAEATRKQRVQTNDAERRYSVSLRRGSSVGKRMNAALSSLAPSSGVPSTLPTSNPNVPMPTGTVFVSETLPPVPATSVQVPMLQNSKQAALKAAQQQVQQVKTGGSSAALLPANQKHGGGQQGQRRRSTSTSQRPPKSYPGSSSLSHGSSSLPLHVGTGTSTLPLNRLAHPRVHFPEARALREKRGAIRTKLNALIHERLERIQQTSSANNADAAVTDQLKSFTSLTEKPSLEEYRLALPRMVLERGVNSPSKLPRRRKTHWDYLLEEMRWLATDFVEERKWKAASARTIASAVASNRLNAVAPIEKKANSDDDKALGEDSADEKNESGSGDAEGVLEMSAESLDEMGARKYTQPGLSDTRLVHSTAHIISDMVAELWTGTLDCGLSAKTDEPLICALARHNKFRKEVESLSECDGAKSTDSDNLTSLQGGSEENKENGSEATSAEEVEKSTSASVAEQEIGKDSTYSSPLSNEEISERIIAATGRVKGGTVRRNRGNAGKEHVKLGSEQRKAVDFVEFIWEGDDSVAPCLNGPVATGKSVLSCYLMWKRRCEGPQLLVCSSARLVSTILLILVNA